MFLIGLGSGTFLTPNNKAIMGSAPSNRRGIASSMIATMRNLGMILGVAISGFVITNRKNYFASLLDNSGYSSSKIENIVIEGALEFTYLIAAGIAFVTVLISLIKGALTK
ncbi:MAG: hypothetical protein ACQEP2_05870 [Actinomycetota bacterium]